MTEFFFDPIQRQERVARLRVELEKLKAQIAVLDAVHQDLGDPGIDPCYLLAVSEIEAKITALEMRHATVH